MNGHPLSARDAGLMRLPGLAGAGSEDRTDNARATLRKDRPKPAWRALYAVVAVTVLLFMAADVQSPTGAWRTVMECLGTALIIGTMALWVRANRVPLALSGEASEARRPLRAWVAYCPPPTPRRRRDLPEIKRFQHLVFHTEQMEKEDGKCFAK